jgi:L-ascorbate metabolism protein UlaG (beta-lactamase superfamily)
MQEMGITLRFLGHAGFQIKAGKKVVYFDLRKYGGVVETSEKADLILISHNHADHCSSEKIQKLRSKDTEVIAPKGCVSKIGGEVKTLKPGEEAEINGIWVKAVEAYNYKRFKSPGKPWHPKGYGVGYLLKIEGKTIYFAGDTDFVPEMRQLGDVDVALLPTGDKYTMDNIEAAEAVLAIKPKTVIPMHMWDTDPQEFKRKVEAKSKINVVVMEKGEEFQIK